MNRQTAQRLWMAFCRQVRAEARWLKVYAVELTVLSLVGFLCTAGLTIQSNRTAMPSVAQGTRAEKMLASVMRGGIDPVRTANLLVEAVIQVESGGHPRKVGRHGERGLMQIKPATWRETTKRLYGAALPFERAFDPDLNVAVGRAYLAHLQKFLLAHRHLWKSNERELLLASYNIGPNAVKRAGFDVRRLPAEVRDYVARAEALHELFLAEQAPVVNAYLSAALASARDGRI